METYKGSLLDIFYKHVSESDWLEGLDLYQSGKVDDVEDFSGLITAKVASNIRSPAEVRLKIHPSGHRIQWIECTCSKYRRRGAYCEHMAAFMINIDRESPQVFGTLDSRMPLSPPSKVKPAPEAKTDDRKITQATDANQKILSHLKGNIHSVSLLANGPNIRVRIEIKAGTLTHYNLDLDSAAKFLESHPRLKNASDDIRELKVYTGQAMRGCRIYKDDTESIVVERVLVLRHTSRSAEKALKAAGILHTEVLQAKHYAENIPGGKLANFEFISLKSCGKYIGKEFMFIPGRGYWPITSTTTSTDWNDLPLRQLYKGDAAAKLVEESFTKYRTMGPIWVDPSLDQPNIQEALALSEISIFKEDNGWFYLDPKYQAGDTKVSMMDLWQHFKNKKRNYLKSGDTWIKIPDFVKDHEWETDGNLFKVNSIGLIRLKAALGDFDSFVGSKRLLNKIRNKLEFSDTNDLPSLKHTKLDLRSYQSAGFSWMWWLKQNGLHGLLADEMGLGKTHQAMAIMSAVQKTDKSSKFLVICPTTVIDHWFAKVQEFCPNLRPKIHHGSKRSQNISSIFTSHDLAITSYGVLLRDIGSLAKVKFAVTILDEAHFIKNNVTSTYKAVCRLEADFRLCLTGTPMENHLGELKNIFDFLIPGYLGSEAYFKKRFLRPIESGGSPESELALQRLIHPFKMRRTKEQVLTDLPPKVEDFRTCELSREQARLYKQIVSVKASPVVKLLQDESKTVPYLHVFQILTLLKQVCDHPALISDGNDYRKHESGKFESFKEVLGEALDSGHKVVVYSQYLGMINIIHKYLTDQKIGHAILTGNTRNRGKVIEQFQTDNDCKVFCGSLMAGGIGIDLTAASVVIHYDRWWNASKENQASDRVHRIGQQKNVQVLKMITKGTLEEKIDQLISSKQSIFEKFLDKDEEMFKKLSRQQLIELLQ